MLRVLASCPTIAILLDDDDWAAPPADNDLL
jgi:hypothetical protein